MPQKKSLDNFELLDKHSPMKSRILIIMAITLIGFQAFGAGPAFTSLTQSDFDNLTKEVSSNFAHTSVMGADSLGKLWGVELSVVGGMSPSPNINAAVTNATGGSSNFPNLYHGGLVLGVTVPFGITGEAVYLPKLTIQGVDCQVISLAAKLTLNSELLPVIPFNLAVRGFQTYSQIGFYQNTGSVTGNLQNSDSTTGLQLLISPKLPALEPYAGVGYLLTRDTLSLSGTGTVFNSSFTSSQSGTSTLVSAQIFLGLDVKIVGLSLGAEYARAFESDRYTAKFGFAF